SRPQGGRRCRMSAPTRFGPRQWPADRATGDPGPARAPRVTDEGRTGRGTPQPRRSPMAMEGPEITATTAVIDNGAYGRREVRFETGRLAQQAAGAVS